MCIRDSAETRAAGVEPVVAKTVDLGTGAYEIRYEITRAGRYHLELTTAGQSRVVVITCEPDALDPPSCEVVRLDDTANKTWRAGEALEARRVGVDARREPLRAPGSVLRGSISNYISCYFEAPVGHPDWAGRKLLGACAFFRSAFIYLYLFQG